MYRALYRKWRPSTFLDVLGQDSIVTALQSQIANDKVGHAYIFTGTRGTGKTSCAKIFAKAVNCEDKVDANPCGVCSICSGIDSGAIMDVVEIDAASNNGVDNIRDLREETVYTPGAGRYKVYIIDEVHMLSGAAFNALLKIMEEPPSHVIFILATTEIHKVPATILSRCQRYDFLRIGASDIQKRLLQVAKAENIDLKEDAARLISRLADGAMRDALSILDTCIGAHDTIDEQTVRRMAGVTNSDYLFALSDAIQQGDAPSAITTIASLRENSIDMKRLCDELIWHYRNIMLACAAMDDSFFNSVGDAEIARYKKVAQTTDYRTTILNIKALCGALERMAHSSDARIELELVIFDMCKIDSTITAQIPAIQSAPNAQGTGASAAYAAPVTNDAAPQSSAPTVNAQSAQPKTYAEPQNSTVSHEVTSVQEDAPISTKEKGADTQFGREPDDIVEPENEPPEDYTVKEDHTGPEDYTAQEVLQKNESPIQSDKAPQEAAPYIDEHTQNSDDIQNIAPTHQSTNTQNITAPEALQEPKTSALPHFEHWQNVLTQMKTLDPLLHSNMYDSAAYFDGKRVLIDGSGLFLEYMRKHKHSNALIRQVIAKVAGKEYAIGPYKKQDESAQSTASPEDNIKKLETQGVPIVYNDNM